MDNSPPILTVRHLTIAFPAAPAPAVNGLSFTLHEGERMGLLGLSGSGKSLTVLALVGLLPAAARVSRGTAEYLTRDGQTVDLLRLTEKEWRTLRGREIGLIFQEPLLAFNPVQRVGAQLREALRSLSPDRADREEYLRDWLRRVELPADQERLLRAYPHQLSGGQRQRILIAMALLGQPRLLLADEPTTALDTITEAAILGLLGRLQWELAMTSVFITHDPGAIVRAADRTIVLEAGREVDRGDSRAIVRTNPLFRSFSEKTAGVVTHPTEAPPVVLRVTDLTAGYPSPGLLGVIFGKRARTQVQGSGVISKVGLRLRAGEWAAVVGPSGCGKTTLARCLTGLLPSAEGRIDLPSDGNVQLIFQDPFASLNPAHTVGRTLREVLRVTPPPPGEASATMADLLAAVRLPPAEFADRYPEELSGGQRQRVAIARALAARPTVLIADEAVSALDVPLRREILNLLDELRRERQLAILFITHDLRLVRERADRIYLMQQGRIVEEGEPAAVFAAPRTELARRLIAASKSADTG